jgi:pimeloyl-ACP methyl ester carboxylesterase
MGGFVGMRLASRQPQLIKSLMLLETTADPEPAENVGRYRLLNLVARWFGLGLVVNQVMPIMFGQKFLTDPTRAELRQVMRKRIRQNHRLGITRAVTGVVERASIYEELGKIQAPTLIVVGDQDVATIPAKSERIQAQIAGSRLVIIPGAGHTATVEEPVAINQALMAFLAEQRRGD